MSKRKGYHGSDQAWIGLKLGPREPMFTRKDGVYSFRNHIIRNNQPLAPGARLVIFHGQHDPDGPVAQRHEWVRRNYV